MSAAQIFSQVGRGHMGPRVPHEGHSPYVSLSAGEANDSTRSPGQRCNTGTAPPRCSPREKRDRPYFSRWLAVCVSGGRAAAAGKCPPPWGRNGAASSRGFALSRRCHPSRHSRRGGHSEEISGQGAAAARARRALHGCGSAPSWCRAPMRTTSGTWRTRRRCAQPARTTRTSRCCPSRNLPHNE